MAKEPTAVAESQTDKSVAVEASVAEMHSAAAYAAKMGRPKVGATKSHAAHTRVPAEMRYTAEVRGSAEMHSSAATPAVAMSSGECGAACKAGEAYQRDCREQRSRHTPHDVLPKCASPPIRH